MTTLIDDPDILHILNDPLARWDRLTAELRDLADEYRMLTERLAILEGQLADEARGTVEQRKRARERAERWKMALHTFEHEARSLTGWIARVWWQLPEAEKARLRSHPDFPAETVAPKLAAAVWEALQRGERLGWMVPF